MWAINMTEGVRSAPSKFVECHVATLNCRPGMACSLLNENLEGRADGVSAQVKNYVRRPKLLAFDIPAP